MDGQHSTLELVIHDQTANFPEHDRSLNAPELDYTLTTPQVRIPVKSLLAVNVDLIYSQSSHVRKEQRSLFIGLYQKLLLLK